MPEADAIIAALPPEWRDYLAAREPLLALVTAAENYAERTDAHKLRDLEWRALRFALADPAIVKLREATK